MNGLLVDLSVTAAEWNEELEAIPRDTFVTRIMSVGASRVHFFRSCDLPFTVVTEYTDETTASSVQYRAMLGLLARAASCVLRQTGRFRR